MLKTATSIALICGLAACAGADSPNVTETDDELFVKPDSLWPNARVPVCWDPVSMDPKYDAERWWIQDAVYNTWEAVSSVRFRGWEECTESQEAGTGVRVVIYEGGEGGQSFVGKQPSGQTRSSIPNCNNQWNREACVRRLAVHELGHTLGFGHEHERPDAKSPCAAPDNNPSYETFGDSEDIDANLNYCNPLFNGGGRLSETDVRGVRNYYGGGGWALEGNLFDAEFYIAANPDLGLGDVEGATIHWLATGLPVEGRRGNRAFDVQYYLSHYGDVSNAIGFSSQHRFMEAANHWRSIGLPNEGRRGSREFDPQYYRNAYGDLNNAFGDDWSAYSGHYEWFGAQVEGRRASADFDVQYYLATYPDLSNAFGSDYNAALVHWLVFGINEGRRGAP